MAQETIPTDGWVKSSFCESSGCVEVKIVDDPAAPGKLEFTRDATGDWLLRSTAHPDRVLRYTPEEWDVFTRGVRNGEFTRRG